MVFLTFAMRMQVNDRKAVGTPLRLLIANHHREAMYERVLQRFTGAFFVASLLVPFEKIPVIYSSILYIYKVAAFFDLCSPTSPWPLDLKGSSLDMFTSGIRGWFV